MGTTCELINKTGNDLADEFHLNINYSLFLTDVLTSERHKFLNENMNPDFFYNKDYRRLHPYRLTDESYYIIESMDLDTQIQRLEKSLELERYYLHFEKIWKSLTPEENFFIRSFIIWLQLAKETGGYKIPV